LKEGVFIGNGAGISNNVAEYRGFIRGLEFLISKNLVRENIVVRSDSKLIIMQMLGCWKIHAGDYVPYALVAKKLMDKFIDIDLRWIPREENDVCDTLGKERLKELGVQFKIQPEKK
jgi:ribonuclease HI